MSRFWRVLMGCVLEELLLAFIQVKKCSQEGREQMAMDIDFLIAFADRMANAQCCPVKREMPDNMKEKLDTYLSRKRPEK